MPQKPIRTFRESVSNMIAYGKFADPVERSLLREQYRGAIQKGELSREEILREARLPSDASFRKSQMAIRFCANLTGLVSIFISLERSSDKIVTALLRDNVQSRSTGLEIAAPLVIGVALVASGVLANQLRQAKRDRKIIWFAIERASRDKEWQ